MLYKGDGSLCELVVSDVMRGVNDTQSYGQIFRTIDMLLLLPVLVFFIFDDPHDCFTCLGKDPDRIYSSFQLTLEERIRRKMVAKYNVAKE